MTSPYLNHPIIDKYDKSICGVLAVWFRNYMEYIKSGEVPPPDVVNIYLSSARHFKAHLTESYSVTKFEEIRKFAMWNMSMRLRCASPTDELTENDRAELHLFDGTVHNLINTVKRKRRHKVLTMVGRAMNKVDILEAFLPREVGMHVISF
jgi:hypothetical protein